MANRPQKVAMIVAQNIIRDVGREDLQPGQLLPPERAMLAKYEIGRGTLREALRLLEFQGVITLKPGPKGGPVLCNPDPSHLASTLVLLMQLKRAPFRSIVEVRVALEPLMSFLATQAIGDDDLAELGGTIEDMRSNLHDEPGFLEVNKRFHGIIAWASGNALLGYLLASLVDIMDGTAIGFDYPAPRRAAILKAHEEIFLAMRERDAAAAEIRMREHINAYVRYAERKFPELLEHVMSWEDALT